MKQNTLVLIFTILVALFALWYFTKTGAPVSSPKPIATTTPETLVLPMTESQWILSPASADGTQFRYPETLGTTYITPTEWPPILQITGKEFSCLPGPVTGADGLTKIAEQRTMGNKSYCVITSVEGAAGSTFTSYEFRIAQGDITLSVAFTLRTPQCMNYDEPKQSECKAEQETFSVDGLADKIASSLRMI